MSSKITSEHLCRGAAVYIRQSTLSQVLENTESQRRQYELAESARAAGFASVTVIDDDLGRSGSGAAERPGFQKLAAAVCAGSIGAVYCIEASRLARNGTDGVDAPSRRHRLVPRWRRHERQHAGGGIHGSRQHHRDRFGEAQFPVARRASRRVSRVPQEVEP